MARRVRMRLFFMVLALAAALAACKPSEFTLRLHMKAGDQFHVSVNTKQDISEELMGQAIDMKQEMTYEYLWEVTNVDAEGNITIKVTYDRIAFSQEQNGQKVAYDSATDDAPPPFLKGMDAMLGKSFEVVVSPKGDLVAVHGLDEMFAQMAKDAGMEDEEAAAFAQGLSNAFGEDSIETQFEAMFSQYPDEPLKVGSTWESDMKVTTMFPMDIHANYTVQAWEGDMVTIGVTSTFAANEAPEQASEDMPFEMHYDFQGTQEGTTVIDLSTGMLKEANITQHMEGKLVLKDPNSDASIDVPLTADTVITMSATRK